jgi:hypothetical protein
MPRARVAVTDSSMDNKERFLALKNLSLEKAKKIQIKTRAIPIEKSRAENFV